DSVPKGGRPNHWRRTPPRNTNPAARICPASLVGAASPRTSSMMPRAKITEAPMATATGSDGGHPHWNVPRNGAITDGRLIPAMDAHWASLAATDPDIAGLIHAEERRQRDKIRLIPSENYVSPAVLAATGSVLTNKYSEGYPGRRYYEGQQFIDQIETIAIER